MPSRSGTVSMSNARIGVIRARKAPSVWEAAGRKVAVAAVADDRNDGCFLDLARDPQRDRDRAARGDACEDALLASHAARRLLRVGLTHVFQPIDPGAVVDLRKIRFGPLADPRNLRT